MGTDGSRSRYHPPGAKKVETAQPTDPSPSRSPAEQPSADEGRPKNSTSPNLRTLDELIQKWIREARLLDHSTPTTKIHESPLSKEIQEYEFPKKFSTQTFDYYSVVSDPV